MYFYEAQTNMAHRQRTNCKCWRNYIVYLLHVICALSLPLSLPVSVCVMCVRAYVNRIGFCVNYYHLISKAAVMFCLQKNKALKPLKALKLLFLYRSRLHNHFGQKSLSLLFPNVSSEQQAQIQSARFLASFPVPKSLYGKNDFIVIELCPLHAHSHRHQPKSEDNQLLFNN